MQNKLKVLTWNIGGAHTINSSAVFDYDKENLSYFVQAIKAVNPDVICIQESHTNDSDVLASRLAKELGFEYVFDSPRSPSHIDENYQLSNAIISRYPIENTKNILLPDPPFELYFEDGKKARLFHTYLQTADIQGVKIANTHLRPLHIFGYSYSEGEGNQFANNIEAVLCSNLNTPLVFAGDFNDPNLFSNFPLLVEKFRLEAALDEQPTNINGNKTDYILFSKELTLDKAELVKAEKADHHLGWAEFKV